MRRIIYIFVLLLSANSLQAQFTLQAGAGYTNYQWYNVGAGGAAPISGATMSSYLANAPGVYFATFDGTDCGSNATEYFVLTANNDTSVVLNAAQNNVGYQWYLNNNLISGANADSLSITSVDTVKYYQAEIVQNGCTKFLPGFHVYHLGIWAPLPVEILDFTAVLSFDMQKVNCSWQTKTEINSSHFIVERSIDQVNWEFVNQVVAAGNSSATLNYNAVDTNPYKGRSYYRLKSFDIDNTFAYSQVEPIYIAEEVKTSVKIYPNPFSDKITIEAPEEEFELLKIYNVLGDIVRDVDFTENQGSAGTKELDVSDLAQGVYFIKTKNTQAKIIKKD